MVVWPSSSLPDPVWQHMRRPCATPWLAGTQQPPCHTLAAALAPCPPRADPKSFSDAADLSWEAWPPAALPQCRASRRGVERAIAAQVPGMVLRSKGTTMSLALIAQWQSVSPVN